MTSDRPAPSRRSPKTHPLAALALLALVAHPLTATAQGEGGARRFAPAEEEPAEPPAPTGVLTRPPAPLEIAEATYPPEALEAGIEADVALIMTIEADGTVGEVELGETRAGHGLDEAAVEAARKSRFIPAEIDGEPAAIRVPFVVAFRLPPPEPPPLARLIGRVVAGVDAAPVEGAQLLLSPGDHETTTDADGAFEFDALEPGDAILTIVADTFEITEKRIPLREGVETSVELPLSPALEGAEIVITGIREPTALTERTLEGSALRTVPGSFGDPLRALQNLPGIQRAPFIVGVLLVRGSGPGDSAVFIDGHEIPLAFHFLGGPSVLPPEMLARLRFYPGNFSVRYGRAIGGIIEVETLRAEPKRWGGSVDIDLFDAGFFVEGPVTERTAISLAARRSYIDAVLQTAAAVTGSDAAAVLPAYYDFQGRVDHRLDSKHRLSLLLFGSNDSLTLVGSPGGATAGENLSAQIGFHRAKGEWHARLGPDLEWTLSPVIGVDLTRFDAGEVQVDGKILEYATRFDLRHDANPELTMRAGADILGRSVFLSSEVPIRVPDYRPYPGSNTGDRTPETVERQLDIIAAALYQELEWRPGGGPWTFSPGVRLDSYHWLGQSRWSADPRATARYAINPAWSLKAGAGFFNQPPQEWRIDPDFGNPDLGLERAWQTGLGFKYQHDEAISLEVEGFYIRRFDLSERSEAVAVESGDSIEDLSVNIARFENIGDGHAFGMEVLLKHEVTRRFYGWLAYTLSRSVDRPSPTEPYTVSFFDQTHILTAVASYRLPAGWEVGGRMRIVSGNPDTPITGGTFDGDRGNFESVEGRRGSTRLPLFNQLDLRVEKTWTFVDWALSAHLDLQNAYNAANREFTAWDYRYRESAPVPGIPILPTFGARATF